MATTRQLFSYSMLFGSFILLIMGTPSSGAEEASNSNNTSSAIVKPIVTPGQMGNVSNPFFPEEHPQSSSPSSMESSTLSSSKGVDVEPKVSPQQLSGPDTAAPVSKSGENVLESLVLSTTVRSLPLGKSVSAEQKTGAAASYTQSNVGQAIVNTTKAGAVQPSLAATGKVKTTTGIMATISTTLRSKFSLDPSQKPRYKGKETEMATTPGQRKSVYHDTDKAITPGQHKPDYHDRDMAVTPGQHEPDYYETSSASSHRPRTTIMRDTVTQETESVTPKARSSGNNHAGIILAVVFCILILLALMGFLYHRHRRHSGSTNFNAAGWAGQVALPDDSGLERDLEQEAVAAPEGEAGTRRNTLVTFFGKHQSRLPSVAMEDISGKREGEECQQLLDEDTGVVCTPEGAGEANGKIAKSSVSSHEASTPSNSGECS